MKVIILPAVDSALDNMKNFKFYLTGGITNPNIVSVLAYDIYGNAVVGVASTRSPLCRRLVYYNA